MIIQFPAKCAHVQYIYFNSIKLSELWLSAVHFFVFHLQNATAAVEKFKVNPGENM